MLDNSQKGYQFAIGRLKKYSMFNCWTFLFGFPITIWKSICKLSSKQFGIIFLLIRQVHGVLLVLVLWLCAKIWKEAPCNFQKRGPWLLPCLMAIKCCLKTLQALQSVHFLMAWNAISINIPIELDYSLAEKKIHKVHFTDHSNRSWFL